MFTVLVIVSAVAVTLFGCIKGRPQSRPKPPRWPTKRYPPQMIPAKKGKTSTEQMESDDIDENEDDDDDEEPVRSAHKIGARKPSKPINVKKNARKRLTKQQKHSDENKGQAMPTFIKYKNINELVDKKIWANVGQESADEYFAPPKVKNF